MERESGPVGGGVALGEPTLLARVSGIADRTECSCAVVRVSLDRILLQPDRDQSLAAGALIELTIEAGTQTLVTLDGEVVQQKDPRQLAVRPTNLDARQRQALAAAAARFSPSEHDDPAPSYAIHEHRRRKVTAVVPEEQLQQLARLPGEVSPTDFDAQGQATPAVVISSDDHGSLASALLSVARIPGADAAPERELIGDPDAVPTLGAAPEDIDWTTLDIRAAPVLALVNGVRSYAEIVSASPLSRMATLRMLDQLFKRGLIRP